MEGNTGTEIVVGGRWKRMLPLPGRHQPGLTTTEASAAAATTSTGEDLGELMAI